MFSILYVDDEPGLLDIGKIFLEKNGLLSVDTILSAQEAMDTLHQTPYDCIVSDYQMPEIDGIEFLKISRRNQPPSGIRPFNRLHIKELQIL